MSIYKPLIDFVTRLRALENAGFEFEAVILVFIGIDMMALLAQPIDKKRQTRSDFKIWVDTYFKAHHDQSYQYNSDDMYAARCSILHNYGSEAEIHDQNPTVKKFGFTDGGRHLINPEVSENLVLIGTASFINDFIISIDDFLNAAKKDKILLERIESRIDKVFAFFPIRDKD